MMNSLITRRVAAIALKSMPSASIHGSNTQFNTALKHVQHKAAFTTVPRIANPNIKITSFEDGKRVDEVVQTDGTTAPAIPADVPYVATGLHPSTRDNMPNTLKNFTLTGKTAVVSGYAFRHVTRNSSPLTDIFSQWRTWARSQHGPSHR